jgi:hypothetical protein
MAFQISPGVNVSEVDLTTVVPSVLTTAGAFAGNFVWGPIKKNNSITKINLVSVHLVLQITTSASSFFTCCFFLSLW